MLAVAGYYDGTVVKPLDPMEAKPNQRVIITVLDEFIGSNEIDGREKHNRSNFFSLAGKIDVDGDAVAALREGSKI